MTNKDGKNANLKPFKPGQSGNPSGRPPLSPEERKLLKLTKAEVARMLNMVAEMTHEEMNTRWHDPKTKAIEKLFIKTILQGLDRDGDGVKSAEFILNRTVGKPKESVEFTQLRRVVEKLDGTKIHYTNEPEGDE